LVEYAVAFPDVAFTGRGPGIDEAIVYDDDDLATPFEQYVDRVIAYWRQRRELGNDQFRPLSHSERSAITAWLAPSFDLIPSLRSRVAQAEAELVELTKVQGRVLRSVRTMDRALIRGGAGTGKTFLAVDEAVRFAVEGRKVLFCCRSPLLARYLRPAMPEDLIDIWDFQSLARDLVDRSGRTSRLPDADDDDLLAVFVPEQAAEGALELGVACSYDVLVLDEAQDLMNEGALDLFDILLDGGMDHGKWRVFLDHKQNVFAALDVEQFKRLAGAAVSQLELVDNCRNTPQIATTTCMLAALDLDETLASEGPDVDVRFAVDANDEATIVGQLLRAWTQSGVEASDIVVLGDESTPPRRVAQRLPAGLPALRAYEEREAGQPSWCSIEDFKGLEAAGVIVIGVRDLSTRKMRRRVYVGCSRARTLLAVVLDVGARDDFNLRAAEFARTVTDRSARSAGPAS
jgi:hypothetical protein